MGCLCCATWAPRFWTHWMTNRRSGFQEPVWFGWRGFTGGKHVFLFESGCIRKQKQGSIFEPLKKHPEIEHNSIYIYAIYICCEVRFWSNLGFLKVRFWTNFSFRSSVFANSGGGTCLVLFLNKITILKVRFWTKMAFFAPNVGPEPD